MSDYFPAVFLSIVIIVIVVYAIRSRRRVAAAKAEQRRVIADARRAVDTEVERLRQQQENPPVVFGRLTPHKMEDEITKELREKTPLRPILRSDEPSESRLRREDGSTFYIGQPFIDDDLNRLQFATRNDGDCIDGRHSPYTNTDRSASNDDTPTTHHTATNNGWGESPNGNGGGNYGGGTTNDNSPASTGDSGGGSFGGD